VPVSLLAVQNHRTLIVGKTYYVDAEDSYTDGNGNVVNNDHVETLVFGTDGKVHDTWIEDGQQKEEIFDYSVTDDVLTVEELLSFKFFMTTFLVKFLHFHKILKNISV